MAVKERKQITGTTAQINAYKGHEGQIVWDKDKKTFVGMSGTAGKNYPLAPTEFVLNETKKVSDEVVKTNAEVAKKASSADLTNGLASKEDKGTCLPLSGGTLSGSLAIKGTASNVYPPVAGIYTKESSQELQIVAGSSAHNEAGASLILYGRDIPIGNKGTFHLLSRYGSEAHDFHSENQHLFWDARYIPNIFSDSQDGFMLKTGRGTGAIFGSMVLSPGNTEYIVNFPHPFIRGPVIEFSLQDNPWHSNCFIVVNSSTSFKVIFSNTLNQATRINYIARGETPW